MATVEKPAPVRAEAKYVRTAPRKAQLVAEQIRGRPVPEARAILAFMARDAARDVEKVLASAVANAEANHGLVGEELYISLATVGAGPTIKRWRARARGRVARIKKRTCHITIALALPEGAVIPSPAPAETKVKPQRAPRKKAAEAAEAVETAPTPLAKSEERPKRTPRKKAAEVPKAKAKPKAKPKAEAKPKAKPKPKTTRKKKESS
jgi:large subunit ribosomal protein L22